MRKNIHLYLIIAVFLAPAVAGYLWKPKITVNHGMLADEHINLSGIEMTSNGHSSDELSFFDNNKWSLLYHIRSDCTQECKMELDSLYQMWATLGLKRQKRVQLYSWSNYDSPSVPAQPRDGYSHLKDSSSDGLRQVITQSLSKLPDFLIVDPKGRVVLYFDKVISINQIRKDLARLLKASRIG